jgi:hypothetical protein
MYIVIDHDIRNAATFQQRAEKAFPLPEGLQVHMFLPAAGMSRATCLYEADSVDRVRSFVDPLLGDSAKNTYVPIAAEHAIGLPGRQAVR